MIKIGDSLPQMTLMKATPDGPEPLETASYFANRTTVLFAVPGAFTPTCSARHLPGFVERRDDFTAKGVDQVACISVNDGFVMGAWGESANATGQIDMIADGNGEFAQALGLDMDSSGFGMGLRSRRYAMIVEDNVVKALNVEEPGTFEVSSADYVLNQL
ncbi:peroxiredoxin [Parvularcula sp. LCG005]|nr:peroxiredoxin [Parvularcula sp. LCG005]WOI53685.1 peroxiredoxin [Parvularcula sp. LCG005]